MNEADKWLGDETQANRRFIARVPLFSLTTGISLATGLMVPSIFELWEQPAARSRHPEMERAAMIAVLVSLVVAAIVWFLYRPKLSEPVPRSTKPVRRVQFGIRHILMAITLVGMLIAVAPLINSIFPWIVMAVGAGLLCWSQMLGPVVRSRFSALLSAMFLPFAWIVPVSTPFGHVSGMRSGIAIGPGLMPAILLRTGNPDKSFWLAAIVVMLEMSLGFWLARRSGSTFIVICIVLVFFVSAFNSLIFHALYQM